MSTTATRVEHDLLGDKAVPADAYYGVQTARALENFHISGVELRLYPNLIKGLAMVKLAAARANVDCGQALRVHCVEGVTANPEVCRHDVEYSIGTVTALNPIIGYERSTELAAEAMTTGRGIVELIREKNILTDAQLADVLDPVAMTGQGRA